MFPQSSQSRFWIFSDENDLTALREKTNAEFIQKHGANMTVSCAVLSSKLKIQFYIFFFNKNINNFEFKMLSLN